MTAAKGGERGDTAGPCDSPASSPHASPKAPASPITPVTLVTGLSGAGNSTAIRALEDMGHEAIDNLPLTFIERLLTQAGAPEAGRAGRRPTALDVAEARPLAALARRGR